MTPTLLHRCLFVMFAAAFLAPAVTLGRTITIDDTQVTMMAHISPEVPRASWIGREDSPGAFSAAYLEMVPGRRLLIRYPLDQIPPGQRIVSAKWFIPIPLAPSVQQRLFVWRLLTSWGPGVCNEFRTIYPKPVRWTAPGASAPGIDRSLQPTAVLHVETDQEQVVDVTQDVELWYTGLVTNNGWALTIDEGNQFLRLDSPMYQGRGQYRLRITYEPE